MKKVFIISKLSSRHDVTITLRLVKEAQKLASDIVVITDGKSSFLQGIEKVVSEVVIQSDINSMCEVIKATDFILLAASSPFAQRVLPRLSAKLDCLYIENVTEIKDYLCYSVDGFAASRSFPEEPYAMTFSCYTYNIAGACSKTHGLSDVILVGGMGLGSLENFRRLAEIAKLMHSDVGATAGAITAGYAPAEYLVGVSGRSVADKIYIGLGVSGAISHTLALDKAKTIIAINGDSRAEILAVADYAVIIDVVVAMEYFEKVLASINGVNICT